jgi:hypothetical protein
VRLEWSSLEVEERRPQTKVRRDWYWYWYWYWDATQEADKEKRTKLETKPRKERGTRQQVK